MKKRIALLILLAAALLLTACGIHEKLEKIDVEQAKSAAMNALGISGEELSYIAAELKERDGKAYYEVKLTVDGVEYVFAVDALSGVIIEQTPTQKPIVSVTPDGYIGQEKAYEIAYTDAGYTAAHAYLISCKLKETEGGARYLLKFYAVNRGYTYEVDALTGEVLSRAYTSTSTGNPNARDTDAVDPEMNVYPLNPAGEDPAMEIIQPPIGDGPVIYLTPAEVNYPILDCEKTNMTERLYSSSEILKAISTHSGYSRTEIKVLAKLFSPVGTEIATHVYFSTPDGKYFYYAVSTVSLEVLRRETADNLSDLSHPLRDSATEVIMPEGMISIEEAYGYALRVNEVYDFDKQTVRTVWADDVILYVAEADYRNGEYEYDFIYQDKETGWFSTVIVRASDGAVRHFGYGKWSKGYFGGFEDMTAVKLNVYQAKSLALSYVPGAMQSDITAFTTDTADGKIEYKGKIVYGGMQFDFTIDGYSGAIRAWTAAPVK